jgi:hypothetical protein
MRERARNTAGGKGIAGRRETETVDRTKEAANEARARHGCVMLFPKGLVPQAGLQSSARQEGQPAQATRIMIESAAGRMRNLLLNCEAAKV